MEIMPPQPPAAQPAASEYSKMDTREVKKASFWISQAFIVLATVLGVFLAASQGFRQAMAFENIRNDRNSYYLRLSLKNEISDNIALLRAYAERIGKGSLADRRAPFALDTFVWESMKNSPSALEIPPELLSDCRNFYRAAADIQRKVADNTYSHTHGVRLVGELADGMENLALPKFEADLDALKSRLLACGAELR